MKQEKENKTEELQKEIDEGLKKLVELGLLKKTNKGWIDSSYSKKIDKMKPRASFLEGLEKGRQEVTKELLEENETRKRKQN